MTLAQTAKPCKAFYAHLDFTPGVLTQRDGLLYFIADATSTVTLIEPRHCNFLAVLGECTLADTQRAMDHLRGGAAMIACQRGA